MAIRRKEKDSHGSITRVVGCGRCAVCLRKKQIDWCFRLGHELKQSTSAIFLTLTYDDDHIPFRDQGFTLLRSDFQKFMKRLRKHVSLSTVANQPKLKYYAVGEYGSKTERPHYHAIIFNLPQPFERFIRKAWKYGHIHIGTVTEASIFYTTKYTLKGLKRKRSEELDEYGREPQFALMSNGLGLGFVKSAVINFLRETGSKLVTVPGGAKKKLPRYYIEKMFPDPEVRMLWTAEANNEVMSSFHDLVITDKERKELIDLYEYRNRQKHNTEKL